ncbi:MAG: type II toxin-antitoxin system VapC family toxin [Anaerolineales bacterium]|nr:type II toxin-antitoxin system VapC family toxin [Anaerolineales bacterium]
MTDAFVLDAWALLAFIEGEEPAASCVKSLLQEARNEKVILYVSILNLGEVYYRIGKTRGQSEADALVEELQLLPLIILPASNEDVMAAARLKMRYSISYADAFAVSTTLQHGAILLTGDPELLELAGQLSIEKLERKTGS